MSPRSGDHAAGRGRAPLGTLAVVGTLLLAISTLWLLVLGILAGRA
ncbi:MULTISPECIES: hypothetical protein [Deinococcus]|uniref:Uncharacterized protein n=1 Tax=Deinococcus rufus TaxID=2136097 RepID=A0ABV7Z6K1_9DEIO|nr:hypothetical protein [Deinococcus sp. AB2017081]WQE96230.1 hypothetical protein U2P90_04855 [Deinococcus sp. AB2017081]